MEALVAQGWCGSWFLTVPPLLAVEGVCADTRGHILERNAAPAQAVGAGEADAVADGRARVLGDASVVSAAVLVSGAWIGGPRASVGAESAGSAGHPVAVDEHRAAAGDAFRADAAGGSAESVHPGVGDAPAADAGTAGVWERCTIGAVWQARGRRFLAARFWIAAKPGVDHRRIRLIGAARARIFRIGDAPSAAAARVRRGTATNRAN